MPMPPACEHFAATGQRLPPQACPKITHSPQNRPAAPVIAQQFLSEASLRSGGGACCPLGG